MEKIMSKKVKVLQREIKALKEDAEYKIENILSENPHGPYTHNILSLILANLSSKSGCDQASNELIEEFSLTTYYGINPRENDEATR